jgi:hypothetical protein
MKRLMPLGLSAVIPEIHAAAKGLLAVFGANDAAVWDIIFCKPKSGGKLQFELPSSMEAIRNQKEDPFTIKKIRRINLVSV